MDLSDEVMTQALFDIERSDAAKQYLQRRMGGQVNRLTSLSAKKAAELEERTGITIETLYDPRGKANTKALKHQTVENFVNTHPWLLIDRLKPFESLVSIIEWFKRGLQPGSTIIMRFDGSLVSAVPA